MNSKIIGFLIALIFFGSSFSFGEIAKSDTFSINTNDDSFLDMLDEVEECAGMVATGNVVKDGRSIFWKNRHINDPTPNKPYFLSGPVYNYLGFGVPGNEVKMAMNEVGLAIGSFTANSPEISIQNRQFESDRSMTPTEVRKYVLGHYSKVKDAAEFIANHVYTSGGVNMGIVSAEPGVGAIVSSSKIDNGEIWSHITWVNNSWQPIDNRLHCEGICQDPDGNGQTIYNIWTDITQNGGSSDFDNKITWEDVCQLGAKNVNGKENGDGAFGASGEISRPNCVSSMVAVSGSPEYDKSLNIVWVALGRQPLVGIFLPLYPNGLSSNSIQNQFTRGDGIESYLNPKVEYATDGIGQGCSRYLCERVREIQSYSNFNEKFMFHEYESLINSISEKTSPATIKSEINSFVNEMVPMLIDAYEDEIRIETVPPEIPIKPIVNTSARPKEKIQFVTSTIHNRNHPLYFLWDWGDGTSSEWIGPYFSDQPAIINHSWAEIGNYAVRVKAKTKTGDQSVWSEPTEIDVWNNNPNTPVIEGINEGKINEPYEFNISSTDLDNDDIRYYISWGDSSEWTPYYPSGEKIQLSHIYTEKGTYVIQVFASDCYGGQSETATLEITMPKNRLVNLFVFLSDWIIQQFPFLEPYLEIVLN